MTDVVTDVVTDVCLSQCDQEAGRNTFVLLAVARAVDVVVCFIL